MVFSADGIETKYLLKKLKWVARFEMQNLARLLFALPLVEQVCDVLGM